jgi:hypothetical protein
VPTDESIRLEPEAPVDQVTVPPQPLAVRVRVPSAQTTFGVGALMVGAEGCETICKPVIVELATLVQEPTLQVADIE